MDEHALGVNVSEIEAPFVLKKRSKDEVLAEIREKLKVLSGVNIEIGQPISHRIDAMLSGTRANIAIKLFGTDLNKMFTIGNQIKASVQDVEGVADLECGTASGTSAIKDRTRNVKCWPNMALHLPNLLRLLM